MSKNTLITPKYQTGSGFCKIYALTYGKLRTFTYELVHTSWISNLDALFNNFMENIISVKQYPFNIKPIVDPYGFGGDDFIRLGKVGFTTTAFVVNDGTNEFTTEHPMPILDVGSFTISRHFNNFLDYAPYTKYELYLPYLGFIELDPELVLGNEIRIRYVVDLRTGDATAYLIRYINATDENIIQTKDGRIGIDIPVGGGAERQIANDMLKLGGSLVTGAIGAATGNPVVAGGALLAGVSTAFNASQYHLQKVGTASPFNALYAPKQAYLTITRPKIARATAYNSLKGRPSGISATLSTLSGYTVVDDVHVEGLATATLSEQQAIEQQLKAGVIL